MAATRNNARACTRLAKRKLGNGFLRPIGIGSMIVGGVLACCAANPAVLTSLGTAELLGIVTLVFAPALTLVAIRLERRWGVAIEPAAIQQATSDIRSTTHEAHDRPSRTHMRPVEASAQAQEESREMDHAA